MDSRLVVGDSCGASAKTLDFMSSDPTVYDKKQIEPEQGRSLQGNQTHT